MIKDYSFGTERSTKIKDYHLKDRMEGQSFILMISGRNIAGWGCHPPTSVQKTSILTPKNLKISNDNKHFYFP
jgi:hypothetical protein